MSASNWYALAAAAALLGLAIINHPWATLVAATLGFGAGLWLANRGPLGRSGVFGVVGFVVAAALAIFNLAR